MSPILNRRFLTHRSFIIEEPELNLFPVAQYELIQLLESNRRDPYWEDFGTIHTYTTHSPYILSALNNLLYANKVSKFVKQQKQNENKQKELELKIKKIVRAEIDANSFNAYQIKDGFAKSIFNRETGLIDDNYIDDATDKINDDFDELMELMK